MNGYAKLFYSIGEPFAAGLFEQPEKSYFYRYCLAYARHFESLRPAPYEAGETLYPCGNKFVDLNQAVVQQFAMTYWVEWDLLMKKSPIAHELMDEFSRLSRLSMGWTHAAPNFKRILKEGLSSYRERVKKQPEGEFREGLLLLLDGMENYIRRSVEYLKSVNAPAELVNALQKVPFAPAETYYEGLVAWNMIFYFDGADNLGYIDDGLAHLYQGEDLTHVIRQMFRNIDAIGTWSCTIGGKYNEITRQALKAIGKLRRPMLELRVNKNMPDDFWELAVANIASGAHNPSFYNDNAIHDMLKSRFPQIPEEDLSQFVGGGCTETNLQGLTRAGGTDGNIPLLKIFELYMHENLTKAETFEEFYEGLCKEAEDWTRLHLDKVITHYLHMAEVLPNPMRTLFTDDCIDKGKDFNAGGARYTWTVSAESGLINVVDSLSAIRELIYEKKQYTPAEFLEKLSVEDPELYTQLKRCPCFGTDDDRVDTIATDFARRIYMVFQEKEPVAFIDGYLISEHQFLRYDPEGRAVGPTPCGRRDKEPTCDSIGALRGKGIKGPTAVLNSASKLPQHLVEAISVLNLTLDRSCVTKVLRPLVESYFERGGMQVQITSTSKEELMDAYENPDKHRDLIVRVGGYSDYFINLSPALRKAVVERDIHTI